MKKSSFILAALGAFTGAALAQSSVTMFGVVDVNARYIKNGDVKTKQLGTDGLSSSRLGFRGIEDLGGGLKAGVWIESAFNPDTGTTPARFWHRRSTVSLLGGFGEVRLGRDLVPTHTAWGGIDSYGGLGLGDPGNLSLALAGATAVDTRVRDDNMISYFLPSNLGGWYGQATVAPGEGVLGKKYIGGKIGYATGPLHVVAAYSTTQADAADNKFKVLVLSAAYDFGVVKLNGILWQAKFLVNKEDRYTLGALMPVGGIGQVRASFTRLTSRGGNIVGNNADQFALGYVHNLSKRTALYADYGRISNEKGAKFTVASTPAGIRAGQTSSGVDFGIVHSF
ncbi:MAG: porin [Rubrivivax sp.]|jgi:predicted porin